MGFATAKKENMLISCEEAARRIRQGDLAAFPTETVYGLGANALDPEAVQKVFALKGRPATSPLIVHVDSPEMARSQVVAEWPPLAEELAKRWWPGPLTLVLPKRPEIPDEVTAGLNTVGVRIPDHPVALELIHRARVPIAAPSANRFTQLSPTLATHVERSFGGQIGVVDGGPCRVGIESTVVAIEDGEPVLLRPGMVTLDDIERAVTKTSGAHPAPGMHPRHYSPRTPLRLVRHAGELPGPEGAYLWLLHPAPETAKLQRTVQMPREAPAYAMKLYGVLHELDELGLPWIAVEWPPEGREWLAVCDRLRRASS